MAWVTNGRVLRSSDGFGWKYLETWEEGGDTTEHALKKGWQRPDVRRLCQMTYRKSATGQPRDDPRRRTVSQIARLGLVLVPRVKDRSETANDEEVGSLTIAVIESQRKRPE